MKSWLRKKSENEFLNFNPTIEQKKRILEKLNDAVTFENFLHTKFLGKKRFSLEGGEATIPALDVAINRGAELGVEEVVVGMAHRGRPVSYTHLDVYKRQVEISISQASRERLSSTKKEI